MALYKTPARVVCCRLPILNKVDFLLEVIRRFGQEPMTLQVPTLHTVEKGAGQIPSFNKTIEVGYLIQNLFTAHASNLVHWNLLDSNDDPEETEYLLDAIFDGIDGVWSYEVRDDEIVVWKYLSGE